MTHGQCKKACLDLLEALRLEGKPVWATGTFSGHVVTDKGRHIEGCREGTADILGGCAGVPLMVEIKTEAHKQQSKEQSKVQAAFEATGGVYLVVRELSVLRSYLRGVGVL